MATLTPNAVQQSLLNNGLAALGLTTVAFGTRWADATPGAGDAADRALKDLGGGNAPLALSLQLHHHRAEHWNVVKGTARVVRGEESFLLGEDESTYIPLGTAHRLENPGKIPLDLIEVQTGSYLGEDDIVRYEDRYGRRDETST